MVQSQTVAYRLLGYLLTCSLSLVCGQTGSGRVRTRVYYTRALCRTLRRIRFPRRSDRNMECPSTGAPDVTRTCLQERAAVVGAARRPACFRRTSNRVLRRSVVDRSLSGSRTPPGWTRRTCTVWQIFIYFRTWKNQVQCQGYCITGITGLCYSFEMCYTAKEALVHLKYLYAS